MQYTVPYYYRNFKCTGSNCPDTCCAGWEIQIDRASLRKYKHIHGALRKRLHNEIDWKNETFRQYCGRCAFLNENNLCDLYLEGGGKKAFCRTCRTYPRHIEEFEGLREISLCLSCPEAARLILTSEEPVHYLHAHKHRRNETFHDFDYFLFTKLEDARTLIFNILNNRSFPITVRSAIILSLSHDLQERIDKKRLFDADRLFHKYSSDSTWTWFGQRLETIKNKEEKRILAAGRLFVIMNQMEILRPDWKNYLRQCRQTLMYKVPLSSAQKSDYRNIFDDILTEQLFVYFIFTYFCGAVYNGNAYGKMKFAFACTVLIRELSRAIWLDEHGSLTKDTIIKTAWRYAREIEHSDYNKTRMEQMLDDNSRFDLESLFLLLE